MTKKTLAKKIKSFLKPSEPEEEYTPDLAAAIVRLTERMDALERKSEQILARLASLPAEIRNAVQPQQRSNTAHAAPMPPRHSPAPQVQPFQRSAPVSPVNSVPVPLSQANSTASAPRERTGRRDRLLFKAVCADCRKDCEVPVKSTEGRPVYCKPCFALRKASKTFPVKTEGSPAPVSFQEPVAPSASLSAPVVPERSAGHVPPQIHNAARRSAVLYMAKKSGHLPSPQAPRPEASGTVVSPARSAAPKSPARARTVRSERPKPKKRSR